MKHKIFAPKLNIPWEDRPEGHFMPIWRYSNNPIIKRNPVKGVTRCYNSSLIPIEDGFIGIFRCDTTTGLPFLYVGRSKNGIDIKLEEKPIVVKNEDGSIHEFAYQYDPRLVELDGVFYITFCTDLTGACLAIIKTVDFANFTFVSYPLPPNNRNGVIFPTKINGEFLMLHRPSDNAHTEFGNIFLSRSKDLIYWGHHELVMTPPNYWWCGLKVGAGPNPILTDLGWLVFFHGVNKSCNGLIYSTGAVILDKDNPGKVRYTCKDFLATPETQFEVAGFVPNVLFPTSVLCDGETGKMALYFGAADSYTELMFTDVDTVLEYILEHAEEKQ